MVLFNYATKEITAKIVYYGPGLCGKTTNLQFIYDSLPSNNKSKMLSLATKTDRTLFFDFLPLEIGKIRGMRTKLQLYTVPGQVYYNSTRQLVLKGADGIVFVADSQDYAVDANNESFQNLEDNLKRQGLRVREMPLVIQFNKRDLPNALPIADLNTAVNKLGLPNFPSVATTGLGVEDTLKGITKLVLSHLVNKYGLEGSEPLDKEIQVLNPAFADRPAGQSVWEEVDDNAAAAAVAPSQPDAEYLVEDEVDENAPLIATELVGHAPMIVPGHTIEAQQPFELSNFFDDASNAAAGIPMPSIEIPIPDGLLESLPSIEDRVSATAVQAERRASDGLVKEITVPVTLTTEEIRKHRRLKLKITLDINLLG